MRPFGELEAVIMEHIWSTDEALTVRDVLSRIDRRPALAYTTVMTVMDNLYRKGHLQRERIGKAYRYWATRGRAEHTADLMHELLGGSGDQSVTLLKFVDQMTPEDISRLKRALDD